MKQCVFTRPRQRLDFHCVRTVALNWVAYQANLPQDTSTECPCRSAAEVSTPLSRSNSVPSSSDPTVPRATGKVAAIDKGELTFPEPRRIRDKGDVKFVAKQPCLICGRRPSDAHHLRFAQTRALGRKVSDEFTVPLCRAHHGEVHRSGEEAAWWKKAASNPNEAARALWLKTHPLPLIPDTTGNEGATAVVTASNPINAKCDRPVSNRGSNYKTKPITSVPQI